MLAGRKVLSRIVVAVAAAVVVLFVAEGIARLVVGFPLVRRVWHPFAHRIPQPNMVDRFRVRDGDLVEVRFNELGMRGPSVAETSPEDALTVVFLGGSTTECYSLPRSETFPELVGRELEQRLERPIRVFNAGMSGASSAHSLARLVFQVVPLDADLVVVMHAINDLLSGFDPRWGLDFWAPETPAHRRRNAEEHSLPWISIDSVSQSPQCPTDRAER